MKSSSRETALHHFFTRWKKLKNKIKENRNNDKKNKFGLKKLLKRTNFPKQDNTNRKRKRRKKNWRVR